MRNIDITLFLDDLRLYHFDEYQKIIIKDKSVPDCPHEFVFRFYNFEITIKFYPPEICFDTDLGFGVTIEEPEDIEIIIYNFTNSEKVNYVCDCKDALNYINNNLT